MKPPTDRKIPLRHLVRQRGNQKKPRVAPAEGMSPDGAPIVDEYLADMMKDMPDPVEFLAADQGKAFFFNVRSDRSANVSRWIRELVCGHFILTRARTYTTCPRCGAMIRAGYDYDGFRRLNHRDKFHWPKDPLRGINELGNRDAELAMRRAEEAKAQTKGRTK